MTVRWFPKQGNKLGLVSVQSGHVLTHSGHVLVQDQMHLECFWSRLDTFWTRLKIYFYSFYKKCHKAEYVQCRECFVDVQVRCPYSNIYVKLCTSRLCMKMSSFLLVRAWTMPRMLYLSCGRRHFWVHLLWGRLHFWDRLHFWSRLNFEVVLI